MTLIVVCLLSEWSRQEMEEGLFWLGPIQSDKGYDILLGAEHWQITLGLAKKSKKPHQHTFNRLTISSLLIFSVISFTPGGYTIFPSPAGFCCCGNSMLVDGMIRSSTGLYGSENKSSTQPCYRTYQNLVLSYIVICQSSTIPTKKNIPVYLTSF